MQTVIDVPHSLILVLVMAAVTQLLRFLPRSEEHTSELQSPC